MKKRQLKDCRLYVIVDQKSAGKRDLVDIAKKAVSGGADIIQLRPRPQTLAKDILKTAARIKAVTEEAGSIFIINDRVDIAYAVSADGVHLGQDDLPIKVARTILGDNKIIGISTHSLSQAAKAQRRGADYISIGPIFRTPIKKGYAPVGVDLIKKVSRRIGIPFFAIGGIDKHNIDKVVAKGAKRVAVVRAVVLAGDVQKAAKGLRDELVRACKTE